jgi:hypothetical protein
MSLLVSTKLWLLRNKRREKLKEENKRDLSVSLDQNQLMEKLTNLNIKIAKRT